MTEYEGWAAGQGLVPEGEPGRPWRNRNAILIYGGADYLEKRDPTYWAVFPASGLKVRLADLGRYAMREQLLAVGTTVPVGN